MALEPPDLDYLLMVSLRDQFDSEKEEEFAELAIQLSADMLEIVTDVHVMPENEAMVRIIHFGIAHMALRLLAEAGEDEHTYSPYSSERLASYSYQLRDQILGGAVSGVPMFDLAMELLRPLHKDHVSVSGEAVFKRPYEESEWASRKGDPWIPDFYGR